MFWLELALLLLFSLPPLLLLVVFLRPPRPPGKVRTSLVLGSGGHTAELLRLVSLLIILIALCSCF